MYTSKKETERSEDPHALWRTAAEREDAVAEEFESGAGLTGLIIRPGDVDVDETEDKTRTDARVTRELLASVLLKHIH